VKHISKISIVLIMLFLLNHTAFAAGNVKLILDEKPKFSIFSLFKKKTPEPSKQTVTDEEGETGLVAKTGTLTVLKNTPTEGTLSFEYTESIEVQFAITAQPQKGTVELTDSAAGTFTYTPNTDELGDDSFEFSVTNEVAGTATATVNVTIIEEEPSPSPSPTVNPSKFRYEDMLGHWGEYSALKLEDLGILRGMQIAGKFYFYPNVELTRGDFILYIVSALKINTEPYAEIASPFADAEEIPAWINLQAKAAYDAGIIKGVLEDGKVYLRPFDKLTRIETIMILNNTIKPNAESSNVSDYADKYLIPQWAQQAVQNMTDYGLLKGYDDNTVRPYVKINRAMAAELIYQTLKYKEANPSMMENIKAELNRNMNF